MDIKEEQLFTVRQAANHLDVHSATIYRAISSGKLRAYQKENGHYRIKQSDLTEYEEAENKLVPVEVPEELVHE